MTPRSEARIPLRIAISKDRFVRILLWITAALGVAHVVCAAVISFIGQEHLHGMRVLTILKEFDLDEEMNLPTYFECFLLALAGALLLLLARHARDSGAPMAFQWRFLGGCFLLMSFDEFASIHEKIGDFLRLHGHVPAHGVLHFTWLAVGIPFVCLTGLLFVPFLLALPSRVRNALVVAGAVYVGGAVGVESIGSWYADHRGDQNMIYALLVLVEETMEMVGSILLIRLAIGEIARQAGEVVFVPAAPCITAPPARIDVDALQANVRARTIAGKTASRI